MIAAIAVMTMALPAAFDDTLVASSTCTPAEIAAYVAGQRGLPSLDQVQAAARAAAWAATDEPEWSRARWRGLVPRLDVSVGTDADLDVRDTIETRTTVEGRALGLRVAARFELGDLVFSDAELRAARLRSARGDAADARVLRATELYFDRVAVALALRGEPSVALALRAGLLDGQLTALTGGLVSFSATSSRTSP